MIRIVPVALHGRHVRAGHDEYQVIFFQIEFSIRVAAGNATTVDQGLRLIVPTVRSMFGRKADRTPDYDLRYE